MHYIRRFRDNNSSSNNDNDNNNVRNDKDADDHEAGNKTKFFVVTMWVMFEVCATMVFLVDIVVWTLLLPSLGEEDRGKLLLNFSSYNVHGTNAVFMLVELLLNRFEFVFSHVLFVVGWALLYACWAWIYFDISGVWIYFFVNTAQKTAPLWYLLLLVMHVLFFSLVYGLWRLKEHQLHRPQREQQLLDESLDAGINDY